METGERPHRRREPLVRRINPEVGLARQPWFELPQVTSM
jgi:hypothetical protein